MRLKDYGRNQKKRKEYIHQSGLLITGVDVSKAKNDGCVRTLEGVRYRIGFRKKYKGSNLRRMVIFMMFWRKSEVAARFVISACRGSVRWVPGDRHF